MERLRIRATSHEHALAVLRQHELLRDAPRRRPRPDPAPSGGRGVPPLALVGRVMAIGRAAGARGTVPPPPTSMVPDCG
jgi:hypothetical protein